jgi:hypothetical protein
MRFDLYSNLVTYAIAISGVGLVFSLGFILKGLERRHPAPLRDFDL